MPLWPNGVRLWAWGTKRLGVMAISGAHHAYLFSLVGCRFAIMYGAYHSAIGEMSQEYACPISNL
jgi:hypothetical protein